MFGNSGVDVVIGGHLEKLIGLGSAALSGAPPALSSELRDLAGSLATQLTELLGRKNGFYAFESALFLRPATSTLDHVGLDDGWNDPSLWKSYYDGMADDALCFAEDIFGGQFCVVADGICFFEPETGELKPMAPDLDAWAEAVLSDYNFLTGFPIAHQWQELHGAIPAGSRLVPKIPFNLGGDYAVDNLVVMEDVKAMRLMGEIATQIKGLPDGTKVKLQITD